MRALEGRQLRERLLVAGTRRSPRLVEALLNGCEVGECQLELDDFAIARGIDGAHHVCHILVLETANDVNDRIRLADVREKLVAQDRKSTRLNSSHLVISYAVFCLKKKTTTE